jgi:hypothetical protein
MSARALIRPFSADKPCVRQQSEIVWTQAVLVSFAGQDRLIPSLLNRANFAVPITPDDVTIVESTGILVDGAGSLTSGTTTARGIQFAPKLVW